MFLALCRLRAVVMDASVSVVYSLQPLPLPIDVLRVLPPSGILTSRAPWELYLANAKGPSEEQEPAQEAVKPHRGACLT